MADPEIRVELAPSEMQSSAVSETSLVRRSEERSVTEVIDQSNKIQDLMQKALKEGQHYGIIPGTKKQSLLKPGAEKINFLFRIGTGDLVVTRTDLPEGHREITIKTPMVHLPTGTVMAYGVGSCSTMESKYRYRQASRLCPQCGKDAIIKGRAEYGGGWLCFAKKGGCGAKFRDDDTTITGQEVGQMENKDIADVYNTVLKMAAKRSYVDGTIKASAASDFFTQDVEDEEAVEVGSNGAQPVRNVTPPPPAEKPKPLFDKRAWLKGRYLKLHRSKWLTAEDKAAMKEKMSDSNKDLEKIEHIVQSFENIASAMAKAAGDASYKEYMTELEAAVETGELEL